MTHEIRRQTWAVVRVGRPEKGEYYVPWIDGSSLGIIMQRFNSAPVMRDQVIVEPIVERYRAPEYVTREPDSDEVLDLFVKSIADGVLKVVQSRIIGPDAEEEEG